MALRNSIFGIRGDEIELHTKKYVAHPHAGGTRRNTEHNSLEAAGCFFKNR